MQACKPAGCSTFTSLAPSVLSRSSGSGNNFLVTNKFLFHDTFSWNHHSSLRVKSASSASLPVLHKLPAAWKALEEEEWEPDSLNDANAKFPNLCRWKTQRGGAALPLWWPLTFASPQVTSCTSCCSTSWSRGSPTCFTHPPTSLGTPSTRCLRVPCSTWSSKVSTVSDFFFDVHISYGPCSGTGQLQQAWSGGLCWNRTGKHWKLTFTGPFTHTAYWNLPFTMNGL